MHVKTNGDGEEMGKKKLVHTLALMYLIALGTIGLPRITPRVLSTSQEIIIFHDDFESYAIGSLPSPPWEFWFNDNGEIVTTMYISSTKSLRLLGSWGWATEAVIKFETNHRFIGYEVYVSAESINKQQTSVHVGFAKRTGPGTSAWFAAVSFSYDGQIYTENGPVQSYTTNRWYKIKVVMDRDYRTYDVWIDDILVASSVPERASEDPYTIEGFNIASDWAEVNCYFDDVRVFYCEVYAWKNNSTFGLENSKLCLHGVQSCSGTVTPDWVFDYLLFKETGTTWTTPWGPLNLWLHPNPSTTDAEWYEIKAYNEEDKSYIVYKVVRDGIKVERIFYIYPNKPYIYITQKVTNLANESRNVRIAFGFTPFIAGDVGDDYYYVPGYGKKMFTGTTKDTRYYNATEMWAAMWDVNNEEGCGLLSTKGFTPSDITSYDWYNIYACGEGIIFNHEKIQLSPGESSEIFDLYIFFFRGTGWESVKEFYDSIKPSTPLTYNLTISALGNGITNPKPGMYHYPAGHVVEVTAIPVNGSTFDHWELDGTVHYENPISVTMNSDHQLVALFRSSPQPPPEIKKWRVKVSGEHDYMPWENIRIKVAAFVIDIETMEPVSNANVTIAIYDQQNNLWIYDFMTEIPNSGIYTWESSQTVDKIYSRYGKGVFTVVVTVFYNDAKIASDTMTLHIDPFPEQEESGQTVPLHLIIIIVAAIAVITIPITLHAKRRNEK